MLTVLTYKTKNQETHVRTFIAYTIRRVTKCIAYIVHVFHHRGPYCMCFSIETGKIININLYIKILYCVK